MIRITDNKKLIRVNTVILTAILMSGCFADTKLTDEEKKTQQIVSDYKNSNANRPDPGDQGELILEVFGDAFAEGNSGTNNQLQFALRTNRKASEEITVSFEIEPVLATADEDYLIPDKTQFTIPAGSSVDWLNIALVGDHKLEASENIKVKLTGVLSGKAIIKTAVAEGIIANDEAAPHPPLLDTGSSVSLLNNGEINTGCDDADAGLQDCGWGRDADVNNNNSADGHLGREYTKLDDQGNPLAADAADWSCIRDELTGLIWEAKKDVPFTEYHSIHAGHSSYDSRYKDRDESVILYKSLYGRDGVLAGYPDVYDENENFEETTFKRKRSQQCANSGFDCTTERYALDINERSLCGFNNWRIPEIWELKSLLVARDGYALDKTFFPPVQSNKPNGPTALTIVSSTPEYEVKDSRLEPLKGDVEIVSKSVWAISTGSYETISVAKRSSGDKSVVMLVRSEDE